MANIEQQMARHYSQVKDRLRSPARIQLTCICAKCRQPMDRPEVFPIGPATIETIIEAVCRIEKISRIDIVSDRRFGFIVKNRQMAMYLCRILTTKSTPVIGNKFGGRDHTTVLHAVTKITSQRMTDRSLDEKLKGYETIFGVA